MHRFRPAFSLSAPLALLLTSVPAQGIYESQSFEPTKFQVGTLAGIDLWSGQDGWLVTDDGGYPPPVQAIQIQAQTVRSGRQAMSWDAQAYKAKGATFAHLRTNKIFNYQGFLDVEMDFRMDQVPNTDTTIWGLNAQYAPSPASSMFYWIVQPDGEVWMLQGQATVRTWWVKTGVRLARRQWYHARTVVDPVADTLELFLDGQPVGSGFKPIYYAAMATHGFTSIVLQDPDRAVLHVDNFRVRGQQKRERLTSDLVEVEAGRTAEVEFRLHPGIAAAHQGYVLIAGATGRSPGVRLPSGEVLPVRFDALSHLVVSQLNGATFRNFAGTLDAAGYATARWETQTPLPSAAKGLTLDFAYVTVPGLDMVSEAWSVQIR